MISVRRGSRGAPLVDLLAQVIEERRASLETSCAAHQGAEPEQRDAETVFCRCRVLLEHSLRDEGHREPVRCALGDPEPARKVADTMSTSSSENALSSRIAVATDDAARGFRAWLVSPLASVPLAFRRASR